MSSTNSQTAAAEWWMMKQALVKASLPLLGETGLGPHDPQIYQRGTGIMLEAEDRLFIVTAAHVLDNIGIENLFFPPKAGADVQSLGGGAVFRVGSPANCDVAVIELTDYNTIQTLKANWTVLSFKNVACNEKYSGGDRLICGYPTATSGPSSRGIEQRPFLAQTVELTRAPQVGAPCPAFDTFFLLRRTGHNTDSELEEHFPELQGVSGCGIWLCADDSLNEVWTSLRDLKLVGTQVSAREGEWIRGAHWDAAAAIFMSTEVGLNNPAAAKGV